MPDLFTGFAAGFTGDQEANYKRNYEQDAAQRAQEGKLYEYLLQSQDPEMRALAMSGLFENAAGGKRKTGLRGAMGEIQGGQFYSQILQRMNEMVPDTSSAPTPPAAPGSAAMSSVQTTRPGSPPPQMPSTSPVDPEVAEMGGGGMPLGPAGSPQSAEALPPPPPPESRWKRRGTGVAMAEEIAERTERVKNETWIKTMTAAVLANGGTQADVLRNIAGHAGAPQAVDTTANGPVLADPNDPATPIPTVRHRDGSITMIDGSPVHPGLVGYVKPATGGGLTSTVEDSPQTRQQLIALGADPAIINAGTGGGAWRVQQRANGSVLVQPSNQPPPPPAYSGAATGVDANGNPVIIGVPRQGVPNNVIAPAVSTQQTQEQSDAASLLVLINKRIAEEENRGVFGLMPKNILSTARKDAIAKEVASSGKLSYTTLLEVQRAARQQRRPSPAPTQPKAAATPGGGGSALSMADQIRADLLTKQSATPTATPMPTPPPPSAPARATGAGPRQ